MPATVLLAEKDVFKTTRRAARVTSERAVTDSPIRDAAPDDGVAEETLRVGMIGLGEIGRKIALSLLEAQYRLSIYEPNDAGLDLLACRGARVANSISDACCSADIVFTMPGTDDAIEAIVLSAGGLADCLPRNAIHISLGTMSVECTDRLVEAHWDAGQRYIAAPILGSPEDAGLGRLRMVAAGRQDTIKEVEPILEAAGEITARVYGWPSLANALQREITAEMAI